MNFKEQLYREILEIGIALSTEKNYANLLQLILQKSMEVTHCDGGTLYLYENGYLHFNIMQTISLDIYQDVNQAPIDLPPVALREENVCAYAAIHKEVINIEDVYNSSRFDFSGPKNYDPIINYHTKSMLVLPLLSHENELIGVVQLINALDDHGNVIAFQKAFERIILSLASQAAVAVSNMRFLSEIKDLLHSFVAAMGAAVDARTPYNGNHTRKVTEHVGGFAKYLQTLYIKGEYEEPFDENRIEQITMAAALHDIGKMIIPLRIMDKNTRLDSSFDKIKQRFLLLQCYYELDYLKGRIDKAAYDAEYNYIEESFLLVKKLNSMGYLPPEYEEPIKALGEKSYRLGDGTLLYYLTEYEKKCLCIKKGTLTNEERTAMENHVLMTSHILENIHFSKNYQNVKLFAGNHHELLDGSGYPRHLTEKDISSDVRILTMIDIYDALTSDDRPYKKIMPQETAFCVLNEMAEEGKLDGKLIHLFEQYMKLPKSDQR